MTTNTPKPAKSNNAAHGQPSQPEPMHHPVQEAFKAYSHSVHEVCFAFCFEQNYHGPAGNRGTMDPLPAAASEDQWQVGHS